MLIKKLAAVALVSGLAIGVADMAQAAPAAGLAAAAPAVNASAAAPTTTPMIQKAWYHRHWHHWHHRRWHHWHHHY